MTKQHTYSTCICKTTEQYICTATVDEIVLYTLLYTQPDYRVGTVLCVLIPTPPPVHYSHFVFSLAIYILVSTMPIFWYVRHFYKQNLIYSTYHHCVTSYQLGTPGLARYHNVYSTLLYTRVYSVEYTVYILYSLLLQGSESALARVYSSTVLTCAVDLHTVLTKPAANHSVPATPRSWSSSRQQPPAHHFLPVMMALPVAHSTLSSEIQTYSNPHCITLVLFVT